MKEMTWHDAIQFVLNEKGHAMHCADITDCIIEMDLRNSYGATPQNTVGAHLANSVKHDGERSPYVKVGKATYGLKSYLVVRRKDGSSSVDRPSEIDTEQNEAGLIHAFGMYWQSDSVHWSGATRLLGQQQPGAEVVDFSEQLGVYLLHDGREVIYVGRITRRPLAKRLYEHTTDRLRGRWDRFSWFGLLGVSDSGSLTEVACNPSADVIAATLEALLIEGLEPRQNRRRGDDFRAVEYLQVTDPEIERVQMQQLLATMQAKLSK